MVKWVDFVYSISDGPIVSPPRQWGQRGFSFGDWLQPKGPIDVIADLRAPVLGLYGEADQGIPVEHVERMRAALKQAGKPGDIILYPAAPHGFHADYRPSYRKEPAEDGWKRMLAWFRQHGAG